MVTITDITSLNFKVTATSGAPVITGQPLLTDDTITVTGASAMTLYYVTTASATPPSAATIKATPDGSFGLAGGANYLPDDALNTAAGTWYLHYLVSNSAGDSAIETEEYVVAAFDINTLGAFVWDASNISTLFQDTAGSTAVTTTGQSVGRMNNTGTLGGSFQNTGATDRPVYTVSGALEYLAFDGSNDYIRWLGSNGDIDLTGGYYICIGMEEVTPSDQKGFLSAAAIGESSLNHASGICLSTASTVDAALYAVGGQTNANGVGIADVGTGVMPLAVVEFEVTPATGSTNSWLRVRRVADGDVVEKGTDAAAAAQHPNVATTTAQLVIGSRVGGGVIESFASMRAYCGVMVLGAVTAQNRTDCRAWVASRIGF